MRWFLAMKKSSFWVIAWSIALSVVMGYFMFKFSGRDLAPDWVRPSLAVMFALIAVMILIRLGRTRIAAFMHFVVGYGTSLFITLMYLYYRSIDAVFTGDDVVAIAQSNPEEVWDFLSHYILNTTSLVSTLVLLVIYYLLFKVYLKLWRPDNQAALFAPYSRRVLGLLRIKSMVLVALSAILLLGSIGVTSQTRPLKYYTIMVQELKGRLDTFHDLVAKLESDDSFQATKEGKGELYVLIIGESLSRDSMGVYNHSVDNTPFLSQLVLSGQAQIFPNAYASFVNTVPSITASFSQGNLATGLTFPYGANLVTVAKKAGFKTHWISNQVKNGSADTPIGAISSLTDYSFFTTNFVFDGSYSQHPDMILIPEIKRTLESLDPSENNLLIIHVMGNHSPYYNRFPADYPKVVLNQAAQIGGLITKPPFNESLIGASDYENYLTAIKYNDMVLSEIGRLTMDREDFEALVYYSDHGEALIYQSFNDIAPENAKEPAGRHNVAQFSFAMTRIPLIVALSEDFKAKYPQTVQALNEHRQDIFTNDTLYDFILDLLQIKSPAINYQLALGNPSYQRGTPDEIELLQHKIVGHDPDYLAFAHAHEPEGANLTVKSANSTFKANSSLAKGYHKLQINTQFESGELYVRVLKDFKRDFYTLEQFLAVLKNQDGSSWLEPDHQGQSVDLLLSVDNEAALSAEHKEQLTAKLVALAPEVKEHLYLALTDQGLRSQLQAQGLKPLALLTSERASSEHAVGVALSAELLANENVLGQVAAVHEAAGLVALFDPSLSVQDADFRTHRQALLERLGFTPDFLVVNYYNAFDSNF